jgi:hypothetical protein
MSPATIAVGQSSTLTWDVAGASDCTAAGAWSGPIAASGSMPVTPTSEGTYTFTLACSTAAGSEVASATLTVTGSAPTIQSFGSAPDPIPVGGPGTLSWTSAGMDTDSCKLRTGGGVLASHLPTSMSGWPIPRSQTRDGTVFTLVCFSGATKFSKTFTISVR